MNPMTPRTRLPRPALALVWVLLAAFVGMGLALASAGSTGTLDGHGPAVALGPELLDREVLASHETNSGPRVISRVGDGRFDERYKAGASKKALAATTELLPAYRWGGTMLSVNVGILGALQRPEAPLMTALSTMLFVIANLLWTALLSLVKFAYTVDIPGLMSQHINSGFRALAEGFNLGGLLILTVVLSVFAGLRLALRGDPTGMLRTIAGAMIPVALIYALLGITSDGSDKTTVGSPAWIASKGVHYTTDIGYMVGGGFATSFRSDMPNVPSDPQLPETAACSEYVRVLYSEYDHRAGQSLRDLVGVNSSESARRLRADQGARNARYQMVALTASLWDQGYLEPWIYAQYGRHRALGERMYCHQLESSKTSAREQLLLANAAGYANVNEGMFAYHSDDGERQAALFAWITCTTSGGTTSLVDGFSGLEGGMFDNSSLGDHCQTWASDGTPPEALESHKLGNVYQATIGAVGDDAVKLNNAKRFYSTYGAYTGGTTSAPAYRITGGLIALVTSAVYLWVIGLIAIGTLAGDFLLVLGMMLLPATLWLLALPGKGGKGGKGGGSASKSLGTKMLRYTMAAMASKLVLTTVLTLFITFTHLIITLVSTF
jgi:hypothetical protein